MILASVFIGIFLLIIEAKNLIKQRQRKELIVITVIICLAIILSVFESIGYKSPLQIMGDWLSPIGEYILK